MRKQGTVIHWDAAHAFGFIGGTQAGADIFFHLKDFRGGPTPKPGLIVSFKEVDGGERGPRAVSVMPAADLKKASAAKLDLQPLAPEDEWAHTASSELSRLDGNGQPRRRRAPPPPFGGAGKAGFAVLLIAWLALLGWGVQAGRLPLGVLLLALPVNLATLFVYWKDKLAAQQGLRRTPEKTLHLCDLLGGWPVGWVAQQVLRHKTRKPAFQAVYWLTALTHCAVLAAWLFRGSLQALASGT